MAVVTIHSEDVRVRQDHVGALLAEFGLNRVQHLDYADMKVTVRIPGVTEADARAACDLYLTPHGVLHFVDA